MDVARLAERPGPAFLKRIFDLWLYQHASAVLGSSSSLRRSAF
jgi:hypothetical protein